MILQLVFPLSWSGKKAKLKNKHGTPGTARDYLLATLTFVAAKSFISAKTAPNLFQ